MKEGPLKKLYPDYKLTCHLCAIKIHEEFVVIGVKHRNAKYLLLKESFLKKKTKDKKIFRKK